MTTFSCWTQNPLGPRFFCKTEAEAITWAKKQDRDKASGYVLYQGRQGRKFLPVQLYTIATGAKP